MVVRRGSEELALKERVFHVRGDPEALPRRRYRAWLADHVQRRAGPEPADLLGVERVAERDAVLAAAVVMEHRGQSRRRGRALRGRAR